MATVPESHADARGMPAVGVMLPRDLPAQLLLPFVRRADALGFAELWVVEDLGYRGGIAQAAIALTATERIRVGIGLLPAAVRSVAFAAMEVNTLAEVHPGRVDVGVGHGIPAWLGSAGLWPDRPLTYLREYVSALQRLLDGETVTVDGEYIHLSAVRLESPAADPPPVLVGGRGSRTLAFSGRRADGTILAEPATPAYLHQALADVSPPDGHRVVTYDVAAIDDDAAVARELARPGLAWVGDPEWSVHIDPLGLREDLRRLRADCADRAEFTRRMPDAWVDELTVCGTPEQARASLIGRAEAGASSAVLIPAGPDPLAALDALGRVLR